MTYLIAVQDKGGREVLAFKSESREVAIEATADRVYVSAGEDGQFADVEDATDLTCYVWDADDKLAEPLESIPVEVERESDPFE
jgi:hypothetical protein